MSSSHRDSKDSQSPGIILSILFLGGWVPLLIWLSETSFFTGLIVVFIFLVLPCVAVFGILFGILDYLKS